VHDSPEAVDPAFDAFLRLFNSGRFWDSHEVLESRWRDDGSEFYHALILLASAFVHVLRGNRHGIAAQLEKARPFLESRAPHYLGLDVTRILEHAAACRQIVAEHPDAPPEAWPVLIPLPKLDFDPARIRGDEFELPE
jgi:predicted metal-dependent hydrolase